MNCGELFAATQNLSAMMMVKVKCLILKRCCSVEQGEAVQSLRLSMNVPRWSNAQFDDDWLVLFFSSAPCVYMQRLEWFPEIKPPADSSIHTGLELPEVNLILSEIF